MTTADAILTEGRVRHPGREALTMRGRTMSYRELDSLVDEWAGRLARAGVLAGHRVAIVSPNAPALIVGMFAAWRRGAVALPFSARFREYDLGRALRDAEVTAVISTPSYMGYAFCDLLPRLLPELPTVRRCFFVNGMGEVEGELAGPCARSPEALDPGVGALLYTSGTTGDPKGALVLHAREIHGASLMAEVLGLSPQDVCVLVVPISHAFGLTCVLSALTAGARVVLIDAPLTLEPTLDAVRGEGATVLHGSPALFTSLLKSQSVGLGAVRTGFVAGGPCPARVIRQMEEGGVALLNLYGMTEIGAACCTRLEQPAEVRYATVGRPLPGYELRVRREPAGEIEVRGPYVSPGYFHRPEEPEAFNDGWFRTGDIGRLDEDGNLSVSGRLKDVINIGGFSVFPAEVEGFLLTHPDVLQAAVVGVSHPTMGEVLEAFIVPRSGALLATGDVLRFARSGLAGYKHPTSISLVDEIPLLASGKVDRAALRAMRAAAIVPPGLRA
jgi:acyl-CoA synthetase (AMP-forming)/AMP-acid ligase II